MSAYSRREFLGSTAAVLLARAAGADTTPFAYAYVGTYTPNGGGIYAFRIELATGGLTQLQVVDDIRNPSWLALSPDQTRLYAVSEIDNYLPPGAQPPVPAAPTGGALVSYAIDPRSMRLTRLSAVASGGNSPAYLSVHPSGKFAFAGNYGSGTVAMFPVGLDGALQAASDVRPSVGPRHRAHAADDQPGQFAISDHDGPHIHMVAADPGGQFVIANDAGLDLTLIWRLDTEARRLLPAAMPVVAAPPGSAPRHFVFHPNGRVFYNLYEHDAKIAVYDYDPSRGALRFKQVLSTLPPKYAGSNLASEILVSTDGRFVYTANRLHNAIASFAVLADGQLRALNETWVHADSPRTLCFDPTGAYLYACNHKSDAITSFHVNAATGALQFTGRYEPVGSPAAMCVLRSAPA